MATPHTRKFELIGADGGSLRGDVRTAGDGRGRPAVVVCHGFKGFKDWGFFPILATRLARAGITAVSFNFSGSGVGPDGESFSEPERFGHATFANDLEDLATVYGALDAGELLEQLVGPTQIGVFGHSRGGGTAALHAARQPSCRAVVTWAAIGDIRRWDAETMKRWRKDGKLDIVNARTGDVLPLYTDVLDEIEQQSDGRLSIRRAASTIEAPWLIVHGDADEAVSVDDGRAIHEAAGGAHVRLEIIKGGAHTFGAKHPWQGSTPQLDHAMDLTVGWFAEYLL